MLICSHEIIYCMSVCRHKKHCQINQTWKYLLNINVVIFVEPQRAFYLGLRPKVTRILERVWILARHPIAQPTVWKILIFPAVSWVIGWDLQGVSCADGYEGEPNATACTSDDTEVPLGGCTAVLSGDSKTSLQSDVWDRDFFYLPSHQYVPSKYISKHW